MSPSFKYPGASKPSDQAMIHHLIDMVSAKDYPFAEQINEDLRQDGFNISIHKLRRLLTAGNIVKIANSEGDRYYKFDITKNRPDVNSKVQSLVVSINHNENMIVLRTVIAGAPLVAKVIDNNATFLEVLGCIAGDDTIIIIPRSIHSIEDICQKLRNLFA